MVRGWAVAASVYLLAVFNRSSLGVAGLIAERRFDIGPGALSTFVMLQVGVYALMQIPTGLLVDRYGPRRLLVAAATILGIAQLAFAFVHVFALALLARALLGCGDALTFVSTLRYSATHFSARRFPLLVALTAVIGTLGNVAATLPLSALLRGAGWTTSFLIAGLASLAGAAAVLALVRDPTPLPPRVARDQLGATVRAVARRVSAAWSVPGTKLGFWMHFTCMATATPFAVLWGQPYLVEGVHFTTAGASTLLMIGVVVAGVANPVIGVLIGRWPHTRIPIGLGISALTIVGLLALVTAFGDGSPKGVAAPIFVAALIGAPASMGAFAVARDYNPASTLGTASGVVNVGGFAATMVGCVGFGVTLDAAGGSAAAAMRFALLVFVAIQLFGLAQLGLWYRRVRAAVMVRQRAGQPVPVPVNRPKWFDVRAVEGAAVVAEEAALGPQ